MSEPAKGFVRGKVMKRVVISFDDETFDALRELAVKEQTSFAEQVRLHVEWGMDATRPGGRT